MNNETIINRFLNHLRRDGKSVLTLSAYATDLKQFAAVLSSAPLTSLTSSLLTAHCSLLIAKLSPNSRARKLTSIREFLRWCYQQGYMKQNLAITVDRPKRATKQPINPLTKSQIGRLRRAAAPLERLLLELLLQTGMKLRDVLSIKMKHVQLRNSLIQHPQSTIYYPLSDHLLQALSYYLTSKAHRSSGLLVSPRGKKLSVRTAHNLLVTLSEKARVRHVTPRNLRTTFIVRQLESGTSPDTIRRIVGLRTSASLQPYLAQSHKIPHNEKIVLTDI